MCHTPYKETFDNMGDAKKYLRVMSARHQGKRLTPYKCECGRVHMTTRKSGRFPL